ncbi:MAG: elongation factor Ts [Candidatus Portnoybacteria bacterium CG10_big_fil_rev_8_21_14_0_10_36_7]|uniref:Elongation factor Ts n=1 Tax=Candidatus Portnoybacteria bacterium CG10_big_fil_rev_8_21_14_0_10_36_7 TaxID=1974812 RepID=A0A2M8KDQ7_9BACT|nr:MAG: elongation factor Ts [Candidatus Portnoybacteria bacterium CG10_big_fil_rev_8_21_14_0_10_36_7]
MISAEQIKKLREKTSASISEVKKALEEAQGDEAKATEILGALSSKIASKKADREIKQGLVESYIHQNGKIGVLVLLGCETDFVAKNPAYKALAKELCMQIVATDPKDVESLLAEPYMREPKKTIQDLVNDYIAKFGENIKINQFSRFAI